MNKEDFIQESVEESLLKIHFLERFKSLSKKFHERNENFHYRNEDILVLCTDLAFPMKFSKSKGFYRKEKDKGVEFNFGFTIKYNSFDIGMTVKDDNKNIFSSAPWHFFADLIQEDNGIERVKFRCNEDLKLILKEVFSIYKDFKEDLLKAYE